MASKARTAFDKNAKDIQRLLDLHAEIGGTGPGRRHGLEVLNKSAIVLTTAYWEAYCEDIAAEGLQHIVKHAKTAEALPKELKKRIAKKLKNADHDLEVWKIADEGWRKYLEDHLDSLKEERDRRLNTPKTEQINELFRSSVGIEKISSAWRRHRRITAARASNKLDEYVTLRGAIAHRGTHETSVTKKKVTDYLELIQLMVATTGGQVNRHALKVTGKRMWLRQRKR